MLASSAATRNEKSLRRAGRKVLVTRFVPLQVESRCPPVPAGARQPQPRCLGTFDGGRPFPERSTRGRGEEEQGPATAPPSHIFPSSSPASHSHKRDRPSSRPRAPKKSAQHRPGQPKGEAVGIYVPLIKTPPPRAGGELPHNISCHGDHKSRKSRNTHL